MSEQRIDELLALAALGELDADEEAELDALLAVDDALADELAGDLDAAARLQSGSAEPPPTHLKQQVMAEVDRIDHATAATDVDDDTTVVRPAPIEHARTRRTRRWRPLAAAAAVVLVLAGGLFVVSNQVGAPGPVEAVLEADDAVVRSLTGELGGGLSAVFSASQDALVLDGSEVAEVGAGETYQVWLVDGTSVQSVGLFRPDNGGDVAVRFDGVDPTDQVIAVTVEPAGGSEAPTPPILATT